MTDLHLTAAALGFGLAVVILYLVRRDHLYLRDGLFWIVVAGASLVLGIWPGLIDRLGQAVGIAYAPALLFLVVILVLLVRSLGTDIALTQMRRDLRRLNQQIALLPSAEELAAQRWSVAENATEGNATAPHSPEADPCAPAPTLGRQPPHTPGPHSPGP